MSSLILWIDTTHSPIYQCQTSRTTPMSDLNGTFNPRNLRKKRCQQGREEKRREERINGIIKGKIGRSKFYATVMRKEVAREVLWNFLELRYGSVGLQKNHRCCPATMSCSSSQMQSFVSNFDIFQAPNVFEEQLAFQSATSSKWLWSLAKIQVLKSVTPGMSAILKLLHYFAGAPCPKRHQVWGWKI